MLGEATVQEQEQLQEWLAADSANHIYYTQLHKIWEESRALASTSTVDADKAWQRFRERIHPAAVRRTGLNWIRMAAVFIIVAGIGLLVYLTGNQSPKEINLLAQQTILNDTLPDGSVVTINKGSAISYPEKFKGDTRQVKLEGEAFFHVTPNKEQPFIVSVNDVQVTVVGTSFNIKTVNGNTEVIVESGIVRVTKAGRTIELHANEKVMVATNDPAFNKQEVDDHLYNYYRTRQFVCEDTPLWKLVEVINEAYGSKIVITDPALRNLPLTTTFNNESLEQVLNIISITFDIEVSREGDTILLKQ